MVCVLVVWHWSLLVLLVRLVRMLLWRIRLWFRGWKCVVPPLLSIFYQPLLLILILVVAVYDVAYSDKLQSAEDDHDVS
jgi:hypothetical protein